MERYSEYKDSGVKWLGKIPSHWEVMPLKSFIKFEKGKTPKEFSDENIGLPYLTMDYLRSRDNKIVKYPTSSIGLFEIEESEALVLWDGANAGEFILSKKGYLGSTMAKISGYREYFNNLYFYYFLKMLEPTSKDFANGTTIPHFDASILINYHYPIPPIDEQIVIGSYLDAATSKIDKAIAMQQKMIDLLNERKQIIIQNAVTKGLDENVEMKDSGVEWIGMIPKHWEIEPFGKHFTFGKGLPITKANLQEEGVAVISYGQVHAKYNLGTTLTETLVRYVSPKYLETHPQCLLNKNDFIFADTSEDVEGSGNFAFNDYKDKIFAGYHTVVARPKDLIYPKYYAYLFKSRAWKSQIQSLVNGVKVYSIGKRILKTSTLLIPSESEQKEIVKVLDLKTAAIEKSIENISHQIALLQERKQIIINEVVTGKVKVS